MSEEKSRIEEALQEPRKIEMDKQETGCSVHQALDWDQEKINKWASVNAFKMVRDLKINLPCDDAISVELEVIISQNALNELLDILQKKDVE